MFYRCDKPLWRMVLRLLQALMALCTDLMWDSCCVPGAACECNKECSAVVNNNNCGVPQRRAEGTCAHLYEFSHFVIFLFRVFRCRGSCGLIGPMGGLECLDPPAQVTLAAGLSTDLECWTALQCHVPKGDWVQSGGQCLRGTSLNSIFLSDCESTV